RTAQIVSVSRSSSAELTKGRPSWSSTPEGGRWPPAIWSARVSPAKKSSERLSRRSLSTSWTPSGSRMIALPRSGACADQAPERRSRLDSTHAGRHADRHVALPHLRQRVLCRPGRALPILRAFDVLEVLGGSARLPPDVTNGTDVQSVRARDDSQPPDFSNACRVLMEERRRIDAIAMRTRSIVSTTKV